VEVIIAALITAASTIAAACITRHRPEPERGRRTSDSERA
jgi:hypothetical protein